MNHKGKRMVKDRKDRHGLQRMNLKNLGLTFQLYAETVMWLLQTFSAL